MACDYLGRIRTTSPSFPRQISALSETCRARDQIFRFKIVGGIDMDCYCCDNASEPLTGAVTATDNNSRVIKGATPDFAPARTLITGVPAVGEMDSIAVHDIASLDRRLQLSMQGGITQCGPRAQLDIIPSSYLVYQSTKYARPTLCRVALGEADPDISIQQLTSFTRDVAGCTPVGFGLSLQGEDGVTYAALLAEGVQSVKVDARVEVTVAEFDQPITSAPFPALLGVKTYTMDPESETPVSSEFVRTGCWNLFDCHSHWHWPGFPFPGAAFRFTSCHGPCPSPQQCLCGKAGKKARVCSGWRTCTCS